MSYLNNRRKTKTERLSEIKEMSDVATNKEIAVETQFENFISGFPHYINLHEGYSCSLWLSKIFT